MHPTLSGKGIYNFLSFPIFTDLFRLLTEIAEVHKTPVTLNEYVCSDLVRHRTSSAVSDLVVVLADTCTCNTRS